MSYQNFEKAISLAKQCEGYWDGGGKSVDIVLKAEQLLGIKFSKQTHQYLVQLGFLEFFGVEIYGIIKDDFSGTPTGCLVEAALVERKDSNLPKEWIPIYFFDDGYMGFLDYTQLNEYGEPPIIMALYNGENYNVAKKVSDDLGDFILKMVENQLENQ